MIWLKVVKKHYKVILVQSIPKYISYVLMLEFSFSITMGFFKKSRQQYIYFMYFTKNSYSLLLYQFLIELDWKVETQSKVWNLGNILWNSILTGKKVDLLEMLVTFFGFSPFLSRHHFTKYLSVYAYWMLNLRLLELEIVDGR